MCPCKNTGHRHPQSERASEDRGRDWETWPPARKSWDPRSWGGREDAPGSLRREPSPTHALFSDLCPHTWGRRDSCCFGPPRGRHFVMTTAGHSHGEDQESSPQRTTSAAWLGHPLLPEPPRMLCQSATPQGNNPPRRCLKVIIHSRWCTGVFPGPLPSLLLSRGRSPAGASWGRPPHPPQATDQTKHAAQPNRRDPKVPRQRVRPGGLWRKSGTNVKFATSTCWVPGWTETSSSEATLSRSD